MKNIKSINNLKNKAGMVIFEFMLVIFIAMLTVGMLIELGFILKSESIVVGITKNISRKIQVSGELTKEDANEFIKELDGYKIRNAKITLLVYDYIDKNKYVKYEFGKDVSNSTIVQAKFRQSFKVYVKGQHSLNLLAITGYTVDVPVLFAENGKGERVEFIN